jgi:saccharopine dehydrogenase-like NADP-dependent oxidoreductase
LKKGNEVYVPTEDLFKDTFTVDFPEVGRLEVYPNRDSIQYIDIYGIPETKTMFRGTFRFPGWCETLDAMKKLKLITYDKMNLCQMTYADLVAALIDAENASDIEKKAAEYLQIEPASHAINALGWLGIFDSKPMNRHEDSPFEVTSDLMIEKMKLAPEEKDMVALQHVFLASYPDGKKEVIKSRMLDFGSPATDTSVARTVALPAAIGVKMILEGKITIKGVYRPVLPEIYNPVLDELENIGIKMIEEFGLDVAENI